MKTTQYLKQLHSLDVAAREVKDLQSMFTRDSADYRACVLLLRQMNIKAYAITKNICASGCMYSAPRNTERYATV